MSINWEAATQKAINIVLYVGSNPRITGDDFVASIDTLTNETIKAALGDKQLYEQKPGCVNAPSDHTHFTGSCFIQVWPEEADDDE